MQLIEDRSKHILIVEDEGLIAADVQTKLFRLASSCLYGCFSKPQ
jgi:hypothetical protein